MNWLFAAQPRGRIAWLRTIGYLFIPVDIFFATPWVAGHADVPGRLYHALTVSRLLHLPVPGPVSVRISMWLLLAASLAAASGLRPRLLGTTVALLYAWWMVIAMSYGKVDHDRYAYLILLAVLPTVGRAGHSDKAVDTESGWALRAVQLGVVATYFLAAVAKLRFGGWNWATGSTLTSAILRRGTFLADPLVGYPAIMVALQWGILIFELASPLLLVGGRVTKWFVAFLYGFHAASYLGIKIAFWPHLVALLAFVPLERLTKAWTWRPGHIDFPRLSHPRQAATTVGEAR